MDFSTKDREEILYDPNIELQLIQKSWHHVNKLLTYHETKKLNMMFDRKMIVPLNIYSV